MAMLTVNGAAVPSPSEMKVTIFETSSAVVRNAAGSVVLDCMGSKRALALRWAHMRGEDLAALLERVGQGGFFEVTYPDPESGAARTMICYASNRTSGILRMEAGAPVWTNVEMTWTER